MPFLVEVAPQEALSVGPFTKKFRYSPDIEYDLEHVKDIAKRAKKNQTRIHWLINDDEDIHLGFIALSIDVLAEKPCLIVDYLFTSADYRGVAYEDLQNLTIGKALLSYAYKMAREADVNYPVRYIALQPANDKLEQYYSEEGFIKLDKSNFMFSKFLLIDGQ